jgi:hypothetical protein
MYHCRWKRAQWGEKSVVGEETAKYRTIAVAHAPLATSTENTIAHRLFSFTSINCEPNRLSLKVGLELIVQIPHRHRCER